jgi:hypothetical protein
MTQNEKDLLLKDLCARLPYGVKFVVDNGQNNIRTLTGIDEAIPYEDWQMCAFARGISAIPVEDIKPYLFPLSSMTGKQKREYARLLTHTSSFEMIQITGESTYDWLNKNMFDWRGLIPMGLAIDATGLNIY